MKKLVLLLAAMGVVSAAAFAGELKVTSVGQELEFEHSQHGKEDDVSFVTSVGLKYDDWSFGIQGAKFYKYGRGDVAKTGLSSSNGRLQLDVWKSITPEFKLGYRYRGQATMDRHYLRYSYNHNMFWTAGDVFYTYNNGKDNNVFHAELYPLGVKYSSVKAGWFVKYSKNIHPKAGNQDAYLENQLRVWAPLYSDDAFSLSVEGRFTLAADKKMRKNADGTKPGYNVLKPGTTRLYLRGNYKATESLSLYGYVGYELRGYNYKDGAKKASPESKNYQDIGLGWTYTF